MRETPATVSAWAEETFGPVGSNFSVACRANREMSELLSAAAGRGTKTSIAEEAADVVIVLWRLVARNNLKPIPVTIELPHGLQSGLASINGRLACLISILATDDCPQFLDVEVSCILERFQAFAMLNHFDLQEHIDRKMLKNRQRRWVLDGNGHGSHVKEPVG